jgi:Arc/MetJ family transcription regulator
MRTNIDIDDKLMKDALRATGKRREDLALPIRKR